MNGVSSGIDWPHLFQQIETAGHVPAASSQVLDGNHAVFRAMYVDLSTVAATVLQSGLNPPLVTIYADVLNIPDGFDYLVQSSALMVLARRVQAGAAARVHVDYRTDASGTLVLFFNELAGSLSIVAVTKDQGADKPWPFDVSAAPPEGGLQVMMQAGVPSLLTRTRAQGVAAWPDQTFTQAMSSEFIFASLLYDDQPELALAMFSWVKNWAFGDAPDLLPLLLSSAAMVSLLSAQINAQRNGAAFVPYLTADIYTQLASAYVAEAQDYETKYLALTTQKVVTDEMIAQAKTLLDNQSYQTDYVQKLLVQAKSNYDNAMAAVQSANGQFNAAQLQVDLVQIKFKDVGIPEFEEKKIIEAVITLAGAIITFGVGIASMLVGDEAGGAASAEAAVEGAKAAEEAAKVGSEIATIAKQLAEVMKKLKTIIEALTKVTELIKSVIEAAENIEHAQEGAAAMASMDVSTGGADLTATYEWQVYQLNADAAMKDPIDQGVGYAEELKTAIDTLAIYGQALAAAQLAAVTAGQKYATVQLQLALAQQQQARLQQLVDSLKTGEAPIVAMMQLFYQRYLNVKSGLFAALEGYRASYFYWALEHSSVQPRVVDPVDQIASGLSSLTAVALDKANALAHFAPNPPQPLRQQLVVIDDPKVLQQLRTTGSTTWAIPADDPDFAHMDRVRLSTIRVWLDATKSLNAGDYSVDMTITSTGNYLDRFAGTPYQFTSAPLQRDFKYRVSATDENSDWEFSNGSYGYVTVDGSVDELVSYAYFEPTPFAEWQIKVATDGLDLSGVRRMTLELAGSVIPREVLGRRAA
jgi:hypothetical protein